SLAQGNGEALYEQYCASCHAAPTDQRTPTRAALGGFTANSIVHALTEGIMAPQGSALSEAQRIEVAEYLSGGSFNRVASSSLQTCSNPLQRIELQRADTWSGWGNGAANLRYQPAAATNLTPGNVSELELIWAFGLENAST